MSTGETAVPARPGGLTRVVAPGKVFLFGEYAVLEGSPALVMAVDRHARARVDGPAVSAPNDLVRFVREAVRAPLAEIESASTSLRAARGGTSLDDVLATGLSVDSSELRLNGSKTGLGSSAAASVAATALYCHLAGVSLAAGNARGAILRAAKVAHDRLQGERGSGADVAASIEGGLLRYELTQAGPRFAATRLPVPLRLVFVPTGVAASTRVLLARVRELRGADSATYNRRLQVLCELADDVARDLDARPAADVCLRVHAYAAHLEALGRDAGIAIISEPHRRIAEIARGVGCAAKPSGAGGGDLAVVFCPDASSASAARAALATEGFPPLDLRPDDVGVRLELEPSEASP